MILSDYFVFLHMPKTGGSFVRELCTRYAPPEWNVKLLDEHPAIRDIPQKYSELPIFAFVRNPFDWYVSWYYYLKKRGDNDFFNLISDHGRRGFRETITAAIETDISELFGMDCYFSESAFGCYMNYMFGNDLDRLQIGRFETLRSDLSRIWSSIIELPEPVKNQIELYPVVNKSDHLHYRTYYDDALRQLIEHKDRRVLQRFGYAFC